MFCQQDIELAKDGSNLPAIHRCYVCGIENMGSASTLLSHLAGKGHAKVVARLKLPEGTSFAAGYLMQDLPEFKGTVSKKRKRNPADSPAGPERPTEKKTKIEPQLPPELPYPVDCAICHSKLATIAAFGAHIGSSPHVANAKTADISAFVSLLAQTEKLQAFSPGTGRKIHDRVAAQLAERQASGVKDAPEAPPPLNVARQVGSDSLFDSLDGELAFASDAVMAPLTMVAARATALEMLLVQIEVLANEPHSILSMPKGYSVQLVGAHALGLSVQDDSSPSEVLIVLPDEPSVDVENSLFSRLGLRFGKLAPGKAASQIQGVSLSIVISDNQPPVPIRVMIGWKSPRRNGRKLNPYELFSLTEWAFPNIVSQTPVAQPMLRLLRYLSQKEFPALQHCDDSALLVSACGALHRLRSNKMLPITASRYFVAVFQELASGVLFPGLIGNTVASNRISTVVNLRSWDALKSASLEAVDVLIYANQPPALSNLLQIYFQGLGPANPPPNK